MTAKGEARWAIWRAVRTTRSTRPTRAVAVRQTTARLGRRWPSRRNMRVQARSESTRRHGHRSPRSTIAADRARRDSPERPHRAGRPDALARFHLHSSIPAAWNGLQSDEQPLRLGPRHREDGPTGDGVRSSSGEVDDDHPMKPAVPRTARSWSTTFERKRTRRWTSLRCGPALPLVRPGSAAPAEAPGSEDDDGGVSSRALGNEEAATSWRAVQASSARLPPGVQWRWRNGLGVPAHGDKRWLLIVLLIAQPGAGGGGKERGGDKEARPGRAWVAAAGSRRAGTCAAPPQRGSAGWSPIPARCRLHGQRHLGRPS